MMDTETSRVVAAFDASPLARTLGMRVTAIEDGAVTVSMDAERALDRERRRTRGGDLRARRPRLRLRGEPLGPGGGPRGGDQLPLPRRRAAHGHRSPCLRDAPSGSLYRVEVRQGDRLVALFSGHGFRLG